MSITGSGTSNGVSMTGYERKTIGVHMYHDKAQVEFPGDRLVVLRWKGNTTTGRVAHSARYVSVPVWSPKLEGQDRAFLPMLQEAFEQAQKEMIHAKVTDALERKEQITALSASEFTPEMILADWESKEGAGGESRMKLSAEAIKTWYDSTLNDVLVLTLAERQGLEADSLDEAGLVKLQKASDNYKKVLSMLASPKPVVTIDQSKLLMKALDLLPMEMRGKDAVLARMVKKLEGIMSRDGDEDMLAGL